MPDNAIATPETTPAFSPDVAEERPSRALDLLLPLGALALVAGWTALLLVAHPAAGEDAAAWSAWIAQWSGPALLIGLGYSFADNWRARLTGRHTALAQSLVAETSALEARVARLNDELAAARNALAAQSRELDTLGGAAVERISQHAHLLALLIEERGAEIEALRAVSTTALGNIEQLREHLPGLTQAAQSTAAAIAKVGEQAHTHVDGLSQSMAALSLAGEASERQIDGLAAHIETALSSLETRTAQLERAIASRFEALEQRSSGFAIDLERHEADVRDALHARCAQMADEINATRARLDASEAEALTSLRARLSGLRDEAATLSRALRDGESSALADWQASITRLSADIARFDAETETRHTTAIAHAANLGAQTEATTLRLAQAEARIEALTIADAGVAASMEGRLDSIDRRLTETDSALEALIERGVRLLELLQSTSQHGREALPAALALGEEQAARLRADAEAAQASGIAMATRAEQTHEAIAALAPLHESLGQSFRAHEDTLGRLHQRLAEMESDSNRVAQATQSDLQAAIAGLQNALREAVATIEQEGTHRVSTLAAHLASASSDALERNMRLKSGEIAGRLEQAAAHAVGVSAEAAGHLALRLQEVAELATNLEQRIADARASAPDSVDDDFARRVVTITDALQSASVDITTALDAEVSDTAWAAYLRGDRSIFTRRAARLLSGAEAKRVLALYEANPGFAGQVNRYIHDFEAMLRHLLATRDGHVLSVTLLSSDMGKVYVALAQAIERLRD
jgi:hypothetical protein